MAYPGYGGAVSPGSFSAASAPAGWGASAGGAPPRAVPACGVRPLPPLGLTGLWYSAGLRHRAVLEPGARVEQGATGFLVPGVPLSESL